MAARRGWGHLGRAAVFFGRSELEIVWPANWASWDGAGSQRFPVQQLEPVYPECSLIGSADLSVIPALK